MACEVAPYGVAAARAENGNGVIASSQSRALASGVLTPALSAINVVNPQALSGAIEQVLSAVGGRGQNVIAVLPESALRVTLLDFDSLPDKHSEAEATLRFRLRKSLPFDVDKAVLSFEAQPAENGVRVLTTIIVSSVLDEYEKAFRDAGCEPGVVLPSSIAALGGLPGDRPSMLLKVAPDATSVVAVRDGQVLLFRTLEGYGEQKPSAQRLADDIYPSLVYFQDTFGAAIEEIYVAGVAEAESILPVLREQTGVAARELIAASVVSGDLRHNFPAAIAALL
ncbi:MAG: hypothetical protein P4M01_05170 [Acidobacteriota bacterium]|nr:hypothetical protein [Acidobacteriota bacterium]